MNNQKKIYIDGNEAAAIAAKQINYHIMGYYPITPSTKISEKLDAMRANGRSDITLVAAEGEHSAAGICYGASACGARVFNATSANGLLYALEQMPVQSGSRMPMVLNVATRCVSGPLSIKCDHSDIMFALNTGWIILYATNTQQVYDMNICAVKIAEKCRLPVIVGYDGFTTSHQTRQIAVFDEDYVVRKFVGLPDFSNSLLDTTNPVAIGTYMSEQDIINNRYQLHLSHKAAEKYIDEIYTEYEEISGRKISKIQTYNIKDATRIIIVLGSVYITAVNAADSMQANQIATGVIGINCVRPFPAEEIMKAIKSAKDIIVLDRQDSYGSNNGGNLSMEILALMGRKGIIKNVYTRIYGLGGMELYEKDICKIIEETEDINCERVAYYGICKGEADNTEEQYMEPLQETSLTKDIDSYSAMPKRIAPGHSACSGCGIFVNVNLLLSQIKGNVVLLFQTGCGMIVSSAYPRSAFKTPYIHNLFQNGAATMTGIVEAYKKMRERGEISDEKITFVMVSGDGGMDIGMGSAIAAALRDDGFILLEYDNGGYMNTGYQQSYSTPKGAKSKTSGIGIKSYGKTMPAKDTLSIMAGTKIKYLATVAESHPKDFMNKAKKAAEYASEGHFVYIKALSACPLNWQSEPRVEMRIVEAAVNSCSFPLYEIENQKLSITIDPQKDNKKIPVAKYFEMMGRTKHLVTEEYREILEEIQTETDANWEKLRTACEKYKMTR